MLADRLLGVTTLLTWWATEEEAEWYLFSRVPKQGPHVSHDKLIPLQLLYQRLGAHKVTEKPSDIARKTVPPVEILIYVTWPQTSRSPLCRSTLVVVDAGVSWFGPRVCRLPQQSRSQGDFGHGLELRVRRF